MVRVLVVDDDAGVREALKVALTAAGFGCDVAGDGEEGLWRLREFAYDLVILDVNLPGADGFEVCRRLRVDRLDVPTLMLTARAGQRDLVAGLDGGADDYLTKPFELPVLLARVRALARRSRPTWSAGLQVGDLVLDPRTGECRRGNTSIGLTAREVQVLEALLRRQGTWVTKRRLLDLVWGPDQDVDENVVEVHLSALRRKIDRPFGTHTVESRRGLGYRVDGPDDA